MFLVWTGFPSNTAAGCCYMLFTKNEKPAVTSLSWVFLDWFKLLCSSSFDYKAHSKTLITGAATQWDINQKSGATVPKLDIMVQKWSHHCETASAFMLKVSYLCVLLTSSSYWEFKLSSKAAERQQIFPGQLLLCVACGCSVCFASSGSGFDLTCSAFSFVWWWFQQLEGVTKFRISCIAEMTCSCFQSPLKLGFLFTNYACFNLLFKCCISVSYLNTTFHTIWKHSFLFELQIYLVFMVFS